MPFIRCTRDKRGYETTYVMHAYRPAQGAGRTRVLYLFRSPAHLRLGRQALDDESRDGLEHTHPDLTFDWSALSREATTTSETPRETRHTKPGQGRQHASGTSDQGHRPQAQPAPQSPAPPPAVDDQTVLGRTLGAAEAVRLRARYRDLLGRIAKRARTPEDRDRLTERLTRLNPDDWADEGAVGAGARTIDADWQAVAQELPQRRRGRRGGRQRHAAGGGADPSGIMAEGGNGNADEHDREMDEPDRPADGRSDGDRAELESDAGGPGTDAGPIADVPGDR